MSKEHMEEFDIGTEGKYNKQGGLNKERGVSQKAEINKRPPPVYSAPKSTGTCVLNKLCR